MPVTRIERAPKKKSLRLLRKMKTETLRWSQKKRRNNSRQKLRRLKKRQQNRNLRDV